MGVLKRNLETTDEMKEKLKEAEARVEKMKEKLKGSQGHRKRSYTTASLYFNVFKNTDSH